MGACGENKRKRTEQFGKHFPSNEDKRDTNSNNSSFTLDIPHNKKKVKEIEIKNEEKNQSEIKNKNKKIKKDIRKDNKKMEAKKIKNYKNNDRLDSNEEKENCYEKKEKVLKKKVEHDIENENVKAKITNLINRTNLQAENEVILGHKPIPIKIIYKITKAVCKLTIETNQGIAHGTGFFLKYSDSKKFLMTCYHVINPTLENNKIELQIHNQKIMRLKFDNRFTTYKDKPIDIAIIEIKEIDDIYNDVEYLNYDKNFMNGGYSIYNDADVFSIEHPGGDDASCASGKIKDIYNNEFEHDIPTDKGSSGCPILLLNNNINLIGVIGIHKEGINTENKKINCGTFIGDILNKEIDIELNNNKNNYIISEIYIKDEDINKNIRIINSYEEYLRNGKDKSKLIKDSKFNNEEEIKKCKIKISDELFSSKYFYKFKSKGKYAIKYIFNNNIKNCC